MYGQYIIYFLPTLLLLKIKRIKHGKLPLIHGITPIINNKGKFEVGNKFRIRCLQFKTEITCAQNAELKIGDNVFINQGVNIYADKSIQIGDNVLIADLAMIHDTSFHEVEEGEGVITKPVVIGDNVWIGARAIILPGVEIGRNTVVAAGSVLSKSVPENCLVAGIPAKVVRKIKCSDDYVRK